MGFGFAEAEVSRSLGVQTGLVFRFGGAASVRTLGRGRR